MADPPSSEEPAPQSEAKPSASALATDEKPISSLRTDDVGELIERLREPRRYVFHAGDCQNCDEDLKEEAASTLSRLRQELEDERAPQWEHVADHWLHMHHAAEQRALKAEDINRKLVEGLRPFAEFSDELREPIHQDAVTVFAALSSAHVKGINGLLISHFRKARSLLSISGGEAAGEDGP